MLRAWYSALSSDVPLAPMWFRPLIWFRHRISLGRRMWLGHHLWTSHPYGSGTSCGSGIQYGPGIHMVPDIDGTGIDRSLSHRMQLTHGGHPIQIIQHRPFRHCMWFVHGIWLGFCKWHGHPYVSGVDCGSGIGYDPVIHGVQELYTLQESSGDFRYSMHQMSHGHCALPRRRFCTSD